jgi:dTDP-4-dehydrorhamnose 3,5-epimerase
MNIVKTGLPGVVIIEPRVFRDGRGSFMETWHPDRYTELGIPARFVQDNVSFSHRGVLRGLHLQHPRAQAKLVSVLQGEVYDVAADVRIGSPTFGKWVGVTLSAFNCRQLYIPDGYAHGFVVTGENATVFYKCDKFYSPQDELSIRWNDPEFDIDWPVADPILSSKDATALSLRDIPHGRLPQYSGSRRDHQFLHARTRETGVTVPSPGSNVTDAGTIAVP